MNNSVQAAPYAVESCTSMYRGLRLYNIGAIVFREIAKSTVL